MKNQTKIKFEYMRYELFKGIGAGIYVVLSNDGHHDFVTCKNGAPAVFAKISAALKVEKEIKKQTDHVSTRIAFLTCKEMQNGAT